MRDDLILTTDVFLEALSKAIAKKVDEELYGSQRAKDLSNVVVGERLRLHISKAFAQLPPLVER